MKSYKKVILTLLVALCGMGVANAQLRFGVKAGLNINKLHLSNVEENLSDDNKCGFTAGVMTEFQVPIIGIGIDGSLMYTRMNSNVEEEGDVLTKNKNFFEIPINLKYKIGLPIVGSIITPYIATGPSFAFKLDKNKKSADPDYEYLETKGCQVVWNVGLGVELVKHLQIQGQYGFGINNIAKKVDSDYGNLKLRNNYWTVTAAWLF